jgi:cobalt-zinc-cadmium efflux system outer membrane protein
VKAARDPLYQRSRAEVAYTTASIARQHAADAGKAARQKLARFWGEETLGASLASDSFFATHAPDTLETYERKLRETPDLARLERFRDARNAELRLAQAGAVPDLTISAGVRRFGGTSDTALIAGVSLPIPVFDQNQGEIARAGAEVTRAVHDRQQAELDRSRELVDAWTQWRTSWSEADRLKIQAMPEAERAFSLVLEGYRVGAFQYLDVLDTQRTLFETRTAYIAALSRMQVARAEVDRLTASPSKTSQSESVR